jgi:hypothetical protein
MESYWGLVLNPWTIFQAMKVTPAISTKMKSPITKIPANIKARINNKGYKYQ